MSTPRTVRSSPLRPATKAAAVTAGTASSTPETAAAASVSSSGKTPPPGAVTCNAAFPAIASMTSTKARRMPWLTISIEHVKATPQASAMTAGASRGQLPRMKRSAIRKLSRLKASPPCSL